MVLYYFALGVVSGYSVEYSGIGTATSTVEFSYEDGSAGLFSKSPQSEKLVNNINVSAPSSVKNASNSLSDFVECVVQLSANEVVSSLRLHKGLSLRFAKFDIVFPFHSFW
jgi:hypothetical protein